MNIKRLFLLLFWSITLVSGLVPSAPRAEVVEESRAQEPFGKLALYRPQGKPKGLVLLVSGDGGWNPDSVKMARAVAELNYLVAGIDFSAYLSRLDNAEAACSKPATDFANLGRFLEDYYPLLPQKAPILMGYGTGAALIYAALAQAPARTFHAGISVDFCPPLPLHKNLCPGQALNSAAAPDGKGIILQPNQHLQAGWFVFQVNPACDRDNAARFINQIDNAKLVSFFQKGQDGEENSGWLEQLTALLQWLDPRIADQVQADTDVSGVPLTEVPAAAGTADKRLAVMVSGDGGWAALDRAIAAGLAKHGIPTVGWDSLSYFWTAKTPDQAGRDLERVLQHYTRAWNKESVLLIGYSFGAEVLPFMANHLSPELRVRVKLVTLLAPSPNASFEFHLTDWIGASSTEGTLPVLPEVKQLGWTKRLCVYGDDEVDSLCPALAEAGVTVLKVPGDHHFDGDYAGIVKHILEQAL
jgi:type IV secretory pathway VirJ component